MWGRHRNFQQKHCITLGITFTMCRVQSWIYDFEQAELAEAQISERPHTLVPHSSETSLASKLAGHPGAPVTTAAGTSRNADSSAGSGSETSLSSTAGKEGKGDQRDIEREIGCSSIRAGVFHDSSHQPVLLRHPPDAGLSSSTRLEQQAQPGALPQNGTHHLLPSGTPYDVNGRTYFNRPTTLPPAAQLVPAIASVRARPVQGSETLGTHGPSVPLGLQHLRQTPSSYPTQAWQHNPNRPVPARRPTEDQRKYVVNQACRSSAPLDPRTWLRR
uniref:Uncharacterized protein n=1 Tax=Chromera velia CCMP2878 TaxID=1169474 RepID=A0A0G4IEH8_9ALVE|eukprot:Cvel_13633.t1-p1 / transcript=Cvel_13633.t1 / gene=Cvel_13633 / organism=Chromera_velia_CCMP2878 / gene_product=hypothetical protein / transcript_product=hypothetical protein / location=Cvel_scaffold939:46781-54389(-) / protein_length=273 / sequence_SO=supercontig / SO=protein_coding / is_pseudo=false